jgi:hypothetical protein
MAAPEGSCATKWRFVVVVAACTLSVAACAARTAGQGGSEGRPRILVIAAREPRPALGDSVAEAVRRELARRAGERLWVIARDDIMMMQMFGAPEFEAWGDDDSRQLGQLLRADAVVDLVASDSGGVVRVRATLFRPRPEPGREIAALSGARVEDVARDLATILAADTALRRHY